MSGEDLVQRLMATFVEELDGHVRSLSRDLVSLRDASSEVVRADLIDSLLRSTHSMKGAAQSVRVEVLSQAAHLMEEILLGLKSNETKGKKSAEYLALLISTVDAVHDVQARLDDDGDLEGCPLELLLPKLDKAAATRTPRSAAKSRPSRVAKKKPAAKSKATSDADSSVPTEAEAQENHVPSEAIDTLAADLTALARNLAEDGAKQVEIRVRDEGVDAEVKLVESLRDPLRHLVRNALDHGIETPAGRLAAGKQPRGRIGIGLASTEEELTVVVADDGRGLDCTALAEEAERLGLEVPDDDASRALLSLAPGLSTSAIVTPRFGRGIGLDAVNTKIRSLGGTVTVQSEPGRGCEWTLRMPLEPRYREALVVEAIGGSYAFPESSIEELRRVRSREVRWILGRPTLLANGRLLPIVSLAELLELAGAANGDERRSQLSGAGVVLQHGQQSLLLRVDNVVGRQPLNPLSLAQRLRGYPLIRGAGTTEDDRVVLVLSPQEILRRALRSGSDDGRTAETTREAAPARKILLAESSYGTRSTLEHVLTSAGLEVAVATDDDSALEILQSEPVDLLITSADQPDRPPSLVERIREMDAFSSLPVVLLAPFDDPSFSREVGDLGVDALVRRTDFNEQRFLETLRRLLQRERAAKEKESG